MICITLILFGVNIHTTGFWPREILVISNNSNISRWCLMCSDLYLLCNVIFEVNFFMFTIYVSFCQIDLYVQFNSHFVLLCLFPIVAVVLASSLTCFFDPKKRNI